MKQPRISDFDPHAKEHKLRSSMDELPSIEKPVLKQPKIAKTEQGTPVLGDQGTRVPPTPNTDEKRKIKHRHPFDFYYDQIDRLKKRSIDELSQGGTGSMSAMVREALDDYLAKIGY
jgi:hypothetical protein